MGSVEAAVLDGEGHGADAKRVVALKRILRAEGSDPQRVEMFLREARLTTLLDHPNVVRALSYGEFGGELFLAMEYIAGEPLSRLVSRTREQDERLPPPVVAYILAEACEGLHAAHELRDADGEPLNVVHRDVSPHNVMIGFDGTVKLLDFGVAKIEALESAGRTKTGEVKGKTAYMSPEQAMGEAIDRRSDLYSVGTVLFECLTGRRMWGVGTDLEVLRRLALEEPPTLAAEGGDVPPELARLHAKLIARDREARPATALAVATELRAYVESSGMKVDPELLRTTMAQLFKAERERREKAI
jgi:serine/threonine protein kinase